MGYSHVDLKWKDIEEQLMRYIDRYFELRFDHNDEQTPLRNNEKGALRGYIQSFDDKNGKWLERIRSIKDNLIKKYTEMDIEVPEELRNLDISHGTQLNIKDRIKIPLKSLYKLAFHDLLYDDEGMVMSYDDEGNFDGINIESKRLNSAISLFALTGVLANRVAHTTLIQEEANDAYEYKHKMLVLLITSIYDYNKTEQDKVVCKFAKQPSNSDGHAYPTMTVRLSKPENFGKISLHFGGSVRNNKHVI